MVCYCAVRMLTKKRLESLLVDYLNRGHYFYNVVVLLDRALYSPARFQRHFLSLESVNGSLLDVD
ncbi:MAG: hypothetical protein DME26_20820 [Verrucomicrobia bacterium]|nr:MAG: hypothetical protein DME26_20820 [Verrucomicrobiota bacterium]